MPEFEKSSLLIFGFSELLHSSASAHLVIEVVEGSALCPPHQILHDITDKMEHCTICPYTICNGMSRLRHDLSGLELKARLLTPETKGALNTRSLSAMLEAYGKGSACAMMQCPSQPTVEKMSPLSLFEVASFPARPATSIGWRDRLKSTMAQQSNHQHHKLICAMEEVCRDLEQRCDSVEKPLCEERSRSQHLSRQLEGEQRQVQSLQKTLEDSKSSLTLYEARNQDSDRQCHSLRQRVEQMEMDLSSAKDRYQREQKDAIAASERTAAAARKQDLTYLETIKCRDEALQEAESLKETAIARATHSEDTLKCLKAEHQMRSDDVVRLTKELEESKRTLCSMQKLLAQKETLLTDSLSLRDSLQGMIQDLKEDSQSVKHQCLSTSQAFKEELAQFSERYRDTLNGKQIEIEDLRQKLQDVFRKHDQELKLLECERAAIIQDHARTVTELESRNLELTHECQDRIEEVAEFRKVGSIFMEAIGRKRTRAFGSSRKSTAGHIGSQKSISNVALDNGSPKKCNNWAVSPSNKRSKSDHTTYTSPSRRQTYNVLTNFGPPEDRPSPVVRKTLGVLNAQKLNFHHEGYRDKGKRHTLVPRLDTVLGPDQENDHKRFDMPPDDTSPADSDLFGSTASL